jgi:hypothetical protein
VFIPQQNAIFLGFFVNSLSMKITLSNEKVVKITSFTSTRIKGTFEKSPPQRQLFILYLVSQPYNMGDAITAA